MSRDYESLLEDEVIRKNRQSMAPVWLLALAVTVLSIVAMVEKAYPRTDRFITTEIR